MPVTSAMCKIRMTCSTQGEFEECVSNLNRLEFNLKSEWISTSIRASIAFEACRLCFGILECRHLVLLTFLISGFRIEWLEFKLAF
jgi:hypothetical protein